MKSIKLYALLLILATAIGVRAAEPAKFQFEIEYNYGIGLKTFGGGYKWKGGFNNNTINLNLLYNINRTFTAGIGIGVESGTRSDNIQVYGDFRYRPFKAPVIKDFYAFTNIGLHIYDYDDNESKLKTGVITDAGIGWLKMFRKHFGIDVKLAYNYRLNKAILIDITETAEYINMTSRKVTIGNNYLSIGLGLVF